MKSFLISSCATIVLSIISFFCGRGYQDLRNGYKLEVLREESVAFPLGTVKRMQVMESVGLGFLDTDTSIIQLGDVTLYKARRAFQESWPVVQKLKVDGNSLGWHDGHWQYQLRIDPVEKEGGKDQAPAKEQQSEPGAAK